MRELAPRGKTTGKRQQGIPRPEDKSGKKMENRGFWPVTPKYPLTWNLKPTMAVGGLRGGAQIKLTKGRLEKRLRYGDKNQSGKKGSAGL